MTASPATRSSVREAEAITKTMITRAVIERGKGILVCRHESTAEQAFEMLVRQSQTRNVTLHLLADEVVASLRTAT